MNEDLIAKAFSARERSHAPYSNFQVGAALRTADGQIFTGANVESSSYGLTLCAERLAICSAIHAGATAIEELAIVADTKGAPTPCGACRQFMFDFAPNAIVHMENLHGDQKSSMVEALIPWAFGPSDLLDRGTPRRKET